MQETTKAASTIDASPRHAVTQEATHITTHDEETIDMTQTAATLTTKSYPETWSRYSPDGVRYFTLDGENVAAADASLRLQRGRKGMAHGACTVLDLDNRTRFIVFDDMYWENDGRGTTPQETVRTVLRDVSRSGWDITAVFDADEDVCLDVEDIDHESPLRDTSDFVRVVEMLGGRTVWTKSSI